MIVKIRASLLLLLFALLPNSSWAGDYEDTIKAFSNAGASGNFFDKSHGYAVLSTIGKGGLMYEASIGGQKYEYKAK